MVGNNYQFFKKSNILHSKKKINSLQVTRDVEMIDTSNLQDFGRYKYIGIYVVKQNFSMNIFYLLRTDIEMWKEESLLPEGFKEFVYNEFKIHF